MHAYLLALEIEPVDINRTYVALPLHLTMMSWFFSDKSPADVVRAIQPAVDAQSSFEIVSGKEDFFGIERDVPVNRIANEDDLRQFHTLLYEALRAVGATYKSPLWVGDGFKPHVTRQRSGRFETGRKHLAAKLYLAEAESPERLQQKKIIYKLTLGNG